jgi:hypothetical protein
MSGVAQASKEAAELSFKLGKEQLAWAKEQFAANKGVTDKVVDKLLEQQDFNQKASEESYQRYKDVFQPAQDRYLEDAESYDTQSRRDQARGSAQAAVGEQFAAARDAATRQLESFGVNPASTRFAALDIGTRAKEAATKAAAGNAADLNTEATGMALRTNAINMGNGLPGQAVAFGSQGQGAGQGAVNSGNATTATGSSAMTAPSAYTGQGVGAIGQWGNTLNQGYKNQLDAWKADQSASSGVGSLLGGLAGLGLSTVPGGSLFGKMFGFEEGGAIPMEASPSNGAVTDDVPAIGPTGEPNIRLNGGEFVMPRDVVMWKGEEWMQKEIQKARQAKQGAVAKPAIGKAPAAPQGAI